MSTVSLGVVIVVQIGLETASARTTMRSERTLERRCVALVALCPLLLLLLLLLLRAAECWRNCNGPLNAGAYRCQKQCGCCFISCGCDLRQQQKLRRCDNPPVTHPF